jgi:stage IV sporulation protein B
MNKGWSGKWARMGIAAGLTWLCSSGPVTQLVSTPDEVRLPLGQRLTLDLRVPGHLQVNSSNARVVEAQTLSNESKGVTEVSVSSHDVGDAVVSTKLFGFLPWKAVHVNVVPREDVMVGGQSIGVILHSHGLIVIGFQRIGTSQASPAADARIQIGDVVERANGQALNSVTDLRQSVSRATGRLELQIRRGREHKQIMIAPVTGADGDRHLGMFVREQTTGVGTLTFYDPKNQRFGALGHLISDADTGQPIEGTGPVYPSEVTGVVRGEPGKPGEKRGRFVRSQGQIGDIQENTPFGVFGKMRVAPGVEGQLRELPVALPEQVHKGAAQILTVLHGQNVEAFNVEIENLVHQDKPAIKSMVVHVTDARLLEQAGGIVQGMSGSPIVQDGRLVGAVTHVFVSDPTRGYGVYAMWMVETCVHPDVEETLYREDIPALLPRYLSPTHAGSV